MSKGQLTGLAAGIITLVLFLVLPVPESMNPLAMKAAGITLMVAIWWISEAIPIAATALMPLLLFPLLGVLETKTTASNYGHPYVWMLVGGFILAKAIEIHNLHKRIALTIINFIGTSKRIIILSFMIATAFLSMWIANVAVTLMMLPIGLAVTNREEQSYTNDTKDQFGLALMLAIAYSASVGGMGTLIGTPPNMVFAGMIKELYPSAPEISFFQWMLVGVPLAIIFLPVIWIYLLKFFKITGNFSHGHEVIREELKSLGPMGLPEKRILGIFIFTALGWIFRKDFQFDDFIIPGWASLFGVQDYVHDATVAIFSAILLFIVPAGYVKKQQNPVQGTKLMDWKSAESIPWGVVIIVGGGYAIANSFKSTELATWIGSELGFISQLPIFTVLLLIVFFIIFLTEINSNTATTNIFLPVLAAMAVAGDAHPFLLMIPATIAASCAFMLPSGTGTNAVIFGSGRIRIPEMAKAGFWLNLISIVVVTMLIYLIAIPVFGISSELPYWVK